MLDWQGRHWIPTGLRRSFLFLGYPANHCAGAILEPKGVQDEGTFPYPLVGGNENLRGIHLVPRDLDNAQGG